MNIQLSKTEIAIANSKTVFGATVKSVSDGLGKTEKIIKTSTNKKLGKKVTKGKYKGFPIFTVTLQERATCPTDCIHWSNCYGNNMPFATRYTVDKQAIELMESELTELQRKYPNGFLVRLHTSSNGINGCVNLMLCTFTAILQTYLILKLLYTVKLQTLLLIYATNIRNGLQFVFLDIMTAIKWQLYLTTMK